MRNRRRSFATGALIAIGACGAVARAQGAPPSRYTAEQVAGCWQFDTTFFSVLEFDRVSGQSNYVHSAIIQLFTDTVVTPWTRGAPARRRVVIAAPIRDERSLARYVQNSGWRLVAGDSIEMSWFNGFSGPSFRLAVSDSTMTGIVDWFFDDGARVPTRSTHATRVACPAGR